VELARKAREAYLAENPHAGTLLVAGSVGPYGAYLADGSEYRGDYVRSAGSLLPSTARAWKRCWMRALTCWPAKRCRRLWRLRRWRRFCRVSRARAWFSFTLRDSEHLSDGTPLREVVSALANSPQIVALGINCIALENTTALKHLQA
jgi:homocysteine S-methyltransferase